MNKRTDYLLLIARRGTHVIKSAGGNDILIIIANLPKRQLVALLSIWRCLISFGCELSSSLEKSQEQNHGSPKLVNNKAACLYQ